MDEFFSINGIDVSYAESIENPEEKYRALLDELAPFNPEEHTVAEEDYDFLDTEEVLVNIKSPDGVTQLDLIFSDSFTLLFGGYKARYQYSEKGFELMRSDLRQIIAGELCTVSVRSARRWMGCEFIEKEEIAKQSPESILEKLVALPPFIDEVHREGGSLSFSFWHSEDNYDVAL